MLNESTETWDNGGARLVLLAPPAPLTTPLLKGAIGMATSNRTRAPWKNKWTHWRVRFWLYVLKTDQCWLWQGAHTPLAVTERCAWAGGRSVRTE
jgi:hypothetical protein